MATVNKGFIESFTGSWGSGMGFLTIKDSATGQLESVPCDNGSTVRALEACFGNVITEGHTAFGDGYKGREIYWSYDMMGLVFESFTPVEEASSALIAIYEYEHDPDVALMEEVRELESKNEQTDDDIERIGVIEAKLEGLTQYCHECGKPGLGKYMTSLELYDTPWADEAETAYFCSDDCLDKLADRGYGDYRYFYCEGCGRWVCEQNPRNGWMTQYRRIDDEQVCLACYQKHILEHGCPREQFENGLLTGMFFSGDNHEVLDAGYSTDPEFHNFKVSTRADGQRVCEAAIAYIDAGGKVVIGYESMAIGGGEGYITLFHK